MVPFTTVRLIEAAVASAGTLSMSDTVIVPPGTDRVDRARRFAGIEHSNRHYGNERGGIGGVAQSRRGEEPTAPERDGESSTSRCPS